MHCISSSLLFIPKFAQLSVEVMWWGGVDYKSNAPATTPTTPAADPATRKFVAIAAPGEVEDEAAEPPPLVAWATWMPKLVVVVVTTVPFAVNVDVTTPVLVVVAVHAVQVVQGALVPQGPFVQPDQVEAGHAPVPHQLVHGPFVHAPLLALAQGPQPWP